MDKDIYEASQRSENSYFDREEEKKVTESNFQSLMLASQRGDYIHQNYLFTRII